MTSVVPPTTAALPLWRRLLPHLLAVVFLLGVAVLYFSPIVFKGQTLSQHDIVQFNGGAQEAAAYRQATGQEALWTNSMFSGMPTYLIGTRFPGDLSVYLSSIFTLGLPAVVANLFVALLCGYLLFVALGMRSIVALTGALALGLTSYNLVILAAGHNSKSYALAYAPLVLAGLLVAFRRQRWLGAALFALGLTMNVRANHLQITYYLLLLVLIFGIVEFVFALREKRLADFLQRSAILGVAALLAVGVSFGRLYTTASYGKYSIRGKSELTTPPPAAPGQPAAKQEAGSGLDRDYAFGWSYGVGETITLLIPNYYGGASSGKLDENSATGKALAGLGVPPVQLRDYLQNIPTYWGDQPITSGPVYVGAVVCLLFVLGLFVADRRTRTWLLVGTILSILLAWGKNFATFNDLMFDYFPGYNKFRSVSMALVIAQLAMPLLAVLALARVLRARPVATVLPGAHPKLPTAAVVSSETADLNRKLLLATGITAGIILLAFIVGLGADFASPIDSNLQQQGFPLDALRQDRASLMRADVFRSLFFVLATAAVLWFYLRRKLTVTVAAGLVAALTLVDLWAVDKRYLGESNFQEKTVAQEFVPSAADQQIFNDPTLHFRVLNVDNPFNEANTSYFHKSIGGYHGAKLRRYQDLIERQISQNNPRIMSMLNARYFIGRDQKTGAPVAQQNPGALGNAWFVSTIQPVQNPDQEMAALSTFDPVTTAIVDVSKFPQAKTSYNAAGSTIRLTHYSPDALSYEANAAQDGFVVFSEIYYADGWNAYLDGKLVPHVRANYVLRAMPVPAGRHKIDFKFEPKEYQIGNTVSLVSSIALFAVLIGAVVYAVRRRPAPDAPAADDDLLPA
ncbi:YfhO family protein [Hymenobacter busanensis]|uniref:YfhO family protein n=1 Tax=Hymenobacter busanensis TaxID=2607656 RepID=A0A7L5A2J3_9BACT|nr:YfhO family protein [Hymenobacter busanensis]KAA9331508.1 YfhO family protein [Hymenobacter busanensis]QHJ08662.1 YfhO family protein [Hymenobacter busanensis]